MLRSAGGETLIWAAFPADTEYFGRLEQQAMVNYRVDDLDAMVAQLRAAGVEVEGPQENENGRFAWGSTRKETASSSGSLRRATRRAPARSGASRPRRAPRSGTRR